MPSSPSPLRATPSSSVAHGSNSKSLARSSNDGSRSASYRGLALRTARKRGEGRSSREVPPPGSTLPLPSGSRFWLCLMGHSRANASMPGDFRLDLIVITLHFAKSGFAISVNCAKRARSVCQTVETADAEIDILRQQRDERTDTDRRKEPLGSPARLLVYVGATCTLPSQEAPMVDPKEFRFEFHCPH